MNPTSTLPTLPDVPIVFPNADPGFIEENLLLDWMTRLSTRAKTHIASAAKKGHQTNVTTFLQDIIQHLPSASTTVEQSRRVILQNLQTNRPPDPPQRRKSVPLLPLKRASKREPCDDDREGTSESSATLVHRRPRRYSPPSLFIGHGPTNSRHLHIAYRPAEELSDIVNPAELTIDPRQTNVATSSPTSMALRPSTSFVTPSPNLPQRENGVVYQQQPWEQHWDWNLASQVASPSPERPRLRDTALVPSSSPLVPPTSSPTVVCPTSPLAAFAPSSPVMLFPGSSSPTRGLKRARSPDESDSESGDPRHPLQYSRSAPAAVSTPKRRKRAYSSPISSPKRGPTISDAVEAVGEQEYISDNGESSSPSSSTSSASPMASPTVDLTSFRARVRANSFRASAMRGFTMPTWSPASNDSKATPPKEEPASPHVGVVTRRAAAAALAASSTPAHTPQRGRGRGRGRG
ncbi:Zn(2)-C6 fungal-type domain-containing protein [Mycena indigotica]|uniref:Zn(2)-C6 fungal-type domain-containing protein n=1 Tax=Mycena indigotica TaxID=2126181 RepID=A0A8H6S2J4_9AGAR|nr:Zn(2)-C6 fungal-type domain-containing protein [Mycena indigotica]KAF7291143.1 Zn(2)-C6 fungal-type domain-containing protein [Mycena indigotica]